MFTPWVSHRFDCDFGPKHESKCQLRKATRGDTYTRNTPPELITEKPLGARLDTHIYIQTDTCLPQSLLPKSAKRRHSRRLQNFRTDEIASTLKTTRD